MRCCCYLLSILILLSLGVELCSARGFGLGVASSQPVCIVDDDPSEYSLEALREIVTDGYEHWDMSGMPRSSRPTKVVLNLSVEEGEIVESGSGVRRHRRLCRECC